MAANKKKQTGNLMFKKDSGNNRFIKFVDKDPELGVRTTDSWVDLDAKVQQFFGYSSYEKYKEDNQADLTREITRDDDGNVISAPTLWPFHVAYVLEEFRDTLDPADYVVVGVPNNEDLKDRGGIVLARQVAAARKDYFKPGGGLDKGMKNPKATLTNQGLIDTTKEKLDFNSKFADMLKDKPVMHPETVATKQEDKANPLFWAQNVGNYKDIANTVDRGEFLTVPIGTSTKKVDSSQITKNEDKFLMEHELVVEKQQFREVINVINEEYRNVLQEAADDDAFYKLIRKAPTGSVVNLFFTKTVTTEVDLFLTTTTVTAFKKGKSYKAEVLKSGNVSVKNETPIDPKEMPKEELIADVKKAGGPSSVLNFEKTMVQYPGKPAVSLAAVMQGPKKAVAKVPVVAPVEPEPAPVEEPAEQPAAKVPAEASPVADRTPWVTSVPYLHEAGIRILGSRAGSIRGTSASRRDRAEPGPIVAYLLNTTKRATPAEALEIDTLLKRIEAQVEPVTVYNSEGVPDGTLEDLKNLRDAGLLTILRFTEGRNQRGETEDLVSDHGEERQTEDRNGGMLFAKAKLAAEYHTKMRVNPLASAQAVDLKIAGKKWGWFALQVADPTGILSVPDLVRDSIALEKNQNLGNFVKLGLSVLSVLPLIRYVGKFVKPGVKGIGKIDDAEKAQEFSDVMVGKIDELAGGLGKEIALAETTGYKIYLDGVAAFFGREAGDIIAKGLKALKEEISKIKMPSAADDVAGLKAISAQMTGYFGKYIARAERHRRKIEAIIAEGGASLSASSKLQAHRTLRELNDYINALSRSRSASQRVIREMIETVAPKLPGAAAGAVADATKETLAKLGLKAEHWDEVTQFLALIRKLGGDRIKEVEAIIAIIRKNKKTYELTDEGLDILVKTARQGIKGAVKPSFIQRVISANASSAGRMLKELIVGARVARRYLEEKGTEQIPSVPIKETDLEFLLLPREWYRRKILTEKEKFIAIRLMIKARPQLPSVRIDRPRPALAPGGAPEVDVPEGEADWINELIRDAIESVGEGDLAADEYSDKLLDAVEKRLNQKEADLDGGAIDSALDKVEERLGEMKAAAAEEDLGGGDDSGDEEYYDKLMAAAEEDAFAKEEKTLTGANVLIFGHSQAGGSKYGRILSADIKKGNSKVTKKVHSGISDQGLAELIKSVPRKNYTHAYLFLGGNTGANGDNYENDKKSIIDHTINVLGVPKKNILVVLPPVNNADPESYDLKDAKRLIGRYTGFITKINGVTRTAKKTTAGAVKETREEYDARAKKRLVQLKKHVKYSAAREEGINLRGRQYIQKLGIKVMPPVIGTKKEDFPDGYHISGKSELALGSTASMVSSFTSAKEVEKTDQVAADASGSEAVKEPSKDKTAVKEIIIDEARKAGVDPEFAVAIATIESGLTPLGNKDNDKSYKGLYMLGNMYKEYYKSKYNFDYDDVYDPRENTKAYLKILKNNLRALRADGTIESPPSKIDPKEAGILYLAHQQGLRGIRTQLKAAAENALYTSLPKDIQSNIYKNVYDSPKHLKGMKWQEWRKKMGEMYKKMGDEAKRLGAVPEKSSARRAWRKLPESNPLYKEYSSLANRYTVRRFVERWKDKAYREYMKALKKTRAVAQTKPLEESKLSSGNKILEFLFKFTDEIENELV